jgi:sugar phosphate isomerase/epimerase
VGKPLGGILKKHPLSVQLYSLREEAKKDVLAVLKKIASFGYQGVEFAGYHEHTPEELKKVLDDLGLKVSSAHGPMPDKSNVAEIIDTAKTLGHTCHISGRGADFFADRAGSEKAGDQFQEASELLRSSGIRFGIHNHWWEFDKKFDGKLPYDVALERAPEAVCEIDTYWVTVGGQDTASIVRRLSARTRFLHIKDGPLDRNQAMTAVGQGKMKWSSILEAADPKVLEWLVVELDRCDTDMMEAVKGSREYLVSKGYVKS